MDGNKDKYTARLLKLGAGGFSVLADCELGATCGTLWLLAGETSNQKWSQVVVVAIASISGSMPNPATSSYPLYFLN